MSRNVKTVFKGFDYMHCDDFARLLMDMAAKGWHFKEWGVGLKFEKGEPEQAVYAVEVFSKASENDMRPEPNTKEFAEYCEAAGWKFIDANQKFCIFKKIDENATELFTPEERIDNSFKGMVTGSAIALLVLYGINAALQWTSLNTIFERYIFSGTFLFSFSIWNVMFIGQLFTFLHAFVQKRRMRKQLQEGTTIYIGNRRDGKIHLSVKDIFVAILILLLTYYFFVMERMGLLIFNVVLICVTVLFAIITNKVRPERDTMELLQMGISVSFLLMMFIYIAILLGTETEEVEINVENFPLVVSDYREWSDEIKDIDYYQDRNFLGTFETYFIFGEEESLSYTIYKSKNTKILDRIWEEEVYGMKYNEGAKDCALEWDAQKAVRSNVGYYYVRYENSILIFKDYEDVNLTSEQIDIILDKLDLR